MLVHAIESRVLFFEEKVHVGGNFVFVAKNEIVVVIENFLGAGLCQRDIALHGDQHGGGARGRRSGGGCRNAGEKEGHGFDRQHLAAQHCVATLGGRDDFVVGARQKFMDGCSGQV